MIWFVILMVLTFVALAARWRTLREDDPAVPYRTLLRLHEIRQRLNVAQFRLETKSEAVRLGRELRHALDEQEREEQ